MNAVKRIGKHLGALALTAALAACHSSQNDHYVGSWHTTPLSDKVTKELFLDIAHASGDNYLVTGYWVSFGGRDRSGKESVAYTMKNGALVGPFNITMLVDDAGHLHAGGMEYSK